MSVEILEPNDDVQRKLTTPVQDVRLYWHTKKYIPDSKMQIFMQVEPEAIDPSRHYLLENYHLYNAILTFDSVVLEHCPNAIFFNYYTPTWLQESFYMSINPSKKQFAISMLVGSKRLTPGHDLRIRFYFIQEHFTSLPITFFRSCAHPLLPEIQTNPLLESTEIHAKYVLFETYQFHITMENSRQANYFTEKLIDCLITRTIPIYYGCPNIETFFNVKGWILLETGTPEELLEKCSVLDASYYAKYSDSIEENFKKALYYKENVKRLDTVLCSINGFCSK